MLTAPVLRLLLRLKRTGDSQLLFVHFFSSPLFTVLNGVTNYTNNLTVSKHALFPEPESEAATQTCSLCTPRFSPTAAELHKNDPLQVKLLNLNCHSSSYTQKVQ